MCNPHRVEQDPTPRPIHSVSREAVKVDRLWHTITGMQTLAEPLEATFSPSACLTFSYPGKCEVLLWQPGYIASDHEQPTPAGAASVQVLQCTLGWVDADTTLALVALAQGEQQLVLNTVLHKDDGTQLTGHGSDGFQCVCCHRVTAPSSLTDLKPGTAVMILLAKAGQPETLEHAQRLCKALFALKGAGGPHEQLLTRLHSLRSLAAPWLHTLTTVPVVQPGMANELQNLWDKGLEALAADAGSTPEQPSQLADAPGTSAGLAAHIKLWKQHFSALLCDLAAVMACAQELDQASVQQTPQVQAGTESVSWPLHNTSLLIAGLRTLELASMLTEFLVQQEDIPMLLLQEVQRCSRSIVQAMRHFDQQLQEAAQADTSQVPPMISRVNALLDRQQEEARTAARTSSQTLAHTSPSAVAPAATAVNPEPLGGQALPRRSSSGSSDYTLTLPPSVIQPTNFSSGGDVSGVRTHAAQRIQRQTQDTIAVMLSGSASTPLGRDIEIQPVQAAEQQDEEDEFLTPAASDLASVSEPEQQTPSGPSHFDLTGFQWGMIKYVMRGFEDDHLESAFLQHQSRSTSKRDWFRLLLLLLSALYLLGIVMQTTEALAWSLPALVMCKAIAFTSSLMPSHVPGRQLLTSTSRSPTTRSVVLAVALALEAAWWLAHLRSCDQMSVLRPIGHLHLLFDSILQPVIMQAPLRHLGLLYSLSMLVVIPVYCESATDLPCCAKWPGTALVLMMALLFVKEAAARHRFARRPTHHKLHIE